MNITFPMMFSNPLRNQRVVEEVYSKVPNNLLYAQFPTFFFQNLPMKIPHFFLHLKNEFYWLSFSWILLHIGTPFWRKSIELTFKVQKKWEIIIDNFWATFIPYACDEFSKSFFWVLILNSDSNYEKHACSFVLMQRAFLLCSLQNCCKINEWLSIFVQMMGTFLVQPEKNNTFCYFFSHWTNELLKEK